MTHIWQSHLGDDVPYDPQYHDNKRVEIASFVNEPPGLVLDIGCGGGATGRLIKQKFPGTRVVGIERNPNAAEHAREFLDQIICENIDTVQLGAHLGNARFDLVLLLDVLEHLYDPWRSLLHIRDWLVPGARVLASVPNIRNLVTLDDLASGQWNYDENGVLDITHVRFFTKVSVKQLFEETGYTVFALEPLLQRELIDRRVVLRGPGRLTTRSVSIKFRDLEDLEDLYAFQYVIDARVQDRAKTPVRAAGHDDTQQ
jgi:SAM-dependent methyltransferase